MGSDAGEDHAQLDVLRNGVLSAAVAGASFFGMPQGTATPSFIAPVHNDVSASQQLDTVEICDPAIPEATTNDLLDATRGEADHLLDFGHEITDDMKQRAEAIQTIEDSTALVPESAEYGDPAPEFWEQSWPEGSAEASAVEFHDAAEPTMDAPLDAGGPIGPF